MKCRRKRLKCWGNWKNCTNLSHTTHYTPNSNALQLKEMAHFHDTSSIKLFCRPRWMKLQISRSLALDEIYLLRYLTQKSVHPFDCGMYLAFFFLLVFRSARAKNTSLCVACPPFFWLKMTAVAQSSSFPNQHAIAEPPIRFISLHQPFFKTVFFYSQNRPE